MENQQSLTLGHRIQERRNQFGWSLRELASQTGLTASFLSQLERGQSNPSLKSLQTIAVALNTSVFVLLMEVTPNSDYLLRSGQRPSISLSSGINYEMISPSYESNRKLMAFLGCCEPGFEQDVVLARQSTEECIHVIKGCLEVVLESESHALDAGDSITFDGVQLRRLVVIGDQETTYISFSTPPPPLSFLPPST